MSSAVDLLPLRIFLPPKRSQIDILCFYVKGLEMRHALCVALDLGGREVIREQVLLIQVSRETAASHPPVPMEQLEAEVRRDSCVGYHSVLDGCPSLSTRGPSSFPLPGVSSRDH